MGDAGVSFESWDLHTFLLLPEDCVRPGWNGRPLCCICVVG